MILKPPVTVLSKVMVKVRASPSFADALLIVTVGVGATSSFTIVPVPVSVAVMVSDVPEMVNPTVKVSSASTTSSSVVETAMVFVSLTVPVKLITWMFSV